MMRHVESQIIHLPDALLIGRKYGDDDRINNQYAHLWRGGEARGIFAAISALPSVCDGYFGYMRLTDTEFEYWIGKLCPMDTVVPDGLDVIEIAARAVAEIQLSASRDEVFAKAHHGAVAAIEKEGWDGLGEGWFGERFPDESVLEDEEELFMMYHITIRQE